MEDEFIDTASDSQAPLLEIADQPTREFLELFTKLDPTINGEIIEKAWKQYDTIGQQIILEGNPSVWMSCAFFTSVWKSTPVGHQELICHYSLLKLIELSQVSVLDFFDKLNKWTDMILASRRLIDFTNRVQSNLAVSSVIFKKLLPIFRCVFTPQKSSTKHLTSAELFEFIWLFFIAMRKQLPTNNEDLMNSFNLLLCVVDYIYQAISISRLKNHLNADFVCSHTNSGKTSLESLCELFEGASLDAKHLSIHWLDPKLLKLVIENWIPFDIVEDKFNNFTPIKKSVEHLYERKMLARAEIDERIFLRPLLNDSDIVFSDKFEDKAISVLFGGNDQLVDTDFLIKFSSQNCLAKLSGQKKIQPPTEGKSYMITPDTVCQNSSFHSDMKQSERMEQLLTLFKAEGKTFNFDFVDCEGNPREYIAEQVNSFGQKFTSKIKEEEKEGSDNSETLSQIKMEKYISDIETLFYCLLQKILIYDQERALAMGLEMNVDLMAILQSSEFLVSIFICAIDLILWVNEDLRTFKWVTELFSDIVVPLEFYRIFELVVRADTSLSREMVKHLNKIEECVLEELAWSSDSPIWIALQNSRTLDQFGESSTVPSSQILSKFIGSVQRNKSDLTPQIVNFFKKVYHLASIRLTDLFERLRIVDDTTRRKIWTLFEHVFRTNILLLKDRHLDQILMCCVYIITKVCSLKTTFQDIIFHYRHQPQASSNIFRNVFMGNDSNGKSVGDFVVEQIERDDLISFYNKIFVSHVEEFVKKLYPSGPESKENLVPLTPMPKTLINPLSPRKIISDRINVIPLSQYSQTIARHRSTRRYDFFKSPSKDLRNINAMINRGGHSISSMRGQTSSYSYSYQ